MKLVIVESPAKAKTIEKFLGKGYKVTSSYGHIRDLPKSKMGVDIEGGTFEPEYITPDKAKPRVTELKKLAKKADEVYYATDEDREGEAIAWHLDNILKVDDDKKFRITFGEITKSAVTNAIQNPREINADLVDAQQARRVLDRLVGYELSPLLWNKVRRGLSAGRVQSVAVRLIVEREEEISKFKSEEYWSLEAMLSKDSAEFAASLHGKDGKRLTKMSIGNKKEMDAIVADLKDADYQVEKIETRDRKRTPPAPFTTSTFQQAAYNQLGMTSKRAMMLAQQLYENGFISYMRTDSTNLSKEATDAAQEAIANEFGAEYGLPNPRVFSKKSKGAQEAHEAIRPTDPKKTPGSLEGQLESAQIKVYRLIWQRMVASQMAEAKLKQVTATIAAGNYSFRATGSTVVFDGYVKALGEKAAFKETVLPEMEKGDALEFQKLVPEQHFTQPPARYSEATLVKALEENGIGRPSTYAPTIDTVQKREYVTKNDEKRLEPTEVGTLVTKILVEHFPEIIDYDFTANIEEDFDRVAAGKIEWQPMIANFYKPFHSNIKKKDKELSKEKLTQEKTGEKCSECADGEMVIKLGRFGKFKACSNYPDCKNTEPIGEEKKIEEEVSGEKCPDCGKDLVLKRGRFGPFLGCSGYPDCKHIKKIEKTTGAKCPKCNKGEIIEKRSKRGRTFYACNQYPDCENAYWSKPTGEKCPDCDSLLVYGAKNTARCSSKECKFSKPLEEEAEE